MNEFLVGVIYEITCIIIKQHSFLQNKAVKKSKMQRQGNCILARICNSVSPNRKYGKLQALASRCYLPNCDAEINSPKK